MRRPWKAVPNSHYEGQITKLVAALLREQDSEGFGVYATTSVQKGEGASTISLLIASEMARHASRRVLLASASDLARLSMEDLSHPEQCWIEGEQRGVLHTVVREGTHGENMAWVSDDRLIRMLMRALRENFRTVIIDSGDLLTSNDIPQIANLVDGVIVVVQAGRSTRTQIEYGLQVISLAGGKLKGFVLNRRTYPIPKLIYHWLRS